MTAHRSQLPAHKTQLLTSPWMAAARERALNSTDVSADREPPLLASGLHETESVTDEGPTAADLGLTGDEVYALLLHNPLSAFVVADPLARNLGFSDVQGLRTVMGYAGRADRGQPLTIKHWRLLIDTVRALIDPDDGEWSTLTGFEQDEHLALLSDVELKVERRTQL